MDSEETEEPKRKRVVAYLLTDRYKLSLALTTQNKLEGKRPSSMSNFIERAIDDALIKAGALQSRVTMGTERQDPIYR